MATPQPAVRTDFDVDQNSRAERTHRRVGKSRHHRGLDVTHADFWKGGIRLLEEMLTEAEELADT